MKSLLGCLVIERREETLIGTHRCWCQRIAEQFHVFVEFGLGEVRHRIPVAGALALRSDHVGHQWPPKFNSRFVCFVWEVGDEVQMVHLLPPDSLAKRVNNGLRIGVGHGGQG